MPKTNSVWDSPQMDLSTNIGGCSAITVEGFKSLCEKQRIEVGPFTILAGANSSGKSSMMQPVLMLKQTLDENSDPGPLLLDGPNVKFTNSDQFFCRKGIKKLTNKFSVGVESASGTSFLLGFKREPKESIDIDIMDIVSPGLNLTLFQGMPQDEIKKEIIKNLIVNQQIGGVVQASNSMSLKESVSLQEAFKKFSFQITKERFFLSIDYDFFTITSDEIFKNHELFLFITRYQEGIRENISEIIKKIIHLPGLRGNPQRTYGRRATGPIFPGVFQDYAASIVLDWKEKKDVRIKELGRQLQKLGLTWKIDVAPIEDTEVEIKVGRMSKSSKGGAQDLVSIADVGFGVSQTLPVLVALLVAKPGQLVYLEQPELHLHPRAQMAMADVIAEAAKRGVRVIVETHSSLFLLRVQTMVAKKILAPELVKLHWFVRGEDGFTKIHSADLDKNGAYGADWPVDFGDVSLKAESEFLDAFEDNAETEE